jgi:leukotriene-A4 hydrolase
VNAKRFSMARIDPHSYFDTEQPRAKHVRLRWQVDFGTRQLIGDATLIFERPSSGQVDLDSNGLTIEAVGMPTGRNVPYTLGDPDPSSAGSSGLISPLIPTR